MYNFMYRDIFKANRYTNEKFSILHTWFWKYNQRCYMHACMFCHQVYSKIQLTFYQELLVIVHCIATNEFSDTIFSPGVVMNCIICHVSGLIPTSFVICNVSGLIPEVSWILKFLVQLLRPFHPLLEMFFHKLK